MKRLVFVLLAAIAAVGQSNTLPQAQATQIDALVKRVLSDTGVPSCSIAIVKDGKIAYANAYGNARLAPDVAAKRETRYAIGSISKQFTAATLLMLQEQGKLSIDDPVAKYFPELTRAKEVTIRNLLSHTSGYQDYYPQDYVPVFMQTPTTAQHIMDVWAKKPLDFDPGTQWQYSNTNFVIAGAIAEKVSGEKLFDMLSARIFRPLEMKSVENLDDLPIRTPDASGYFRYAAGPPVVETPEAPGWLFAAGELYMTASDLARWDISVMEQTILSPASYKQLETEVPLKSGAHTGYALGVDVGTRNGHRYVAHDGEVAGFIADNLVLPDDKMAVVILTNEMASHAAGPIESGTMKLLLGGSAQASGEETKRTAEMRSILEQLAQGKIDRSLFTEDCNQFFSDKALEAYRASLTEQGKLVSFTQDGDARSRGGMTLRAYDAIYSNGKKFAVTTFTTPEKKLEQFLVVPRE